MQVIYSLVHLGLFVAGAAVSGPPNPPDSIVGLFRHHLHEQPEPCGADIVSDATELQRFEVSHKI